MAKYIQSTNTFCSQLGILRALRARVLWPSLLSLISFYQLVSTPLYASVKVLAEAEGRMATATVTMSVADTSFFGDSLGSHSETVKIRYPCHYRDKPPKSIVCVSSLGEKLEAACTIQSVDFKACEYEFLSEEEANNIIATRLQDVENNLNRQFDKIGNDINSQVTTSLNKLNESWNSPEKKREMKELVDAKLSELVPTIKEEFRSVINEELSKFKTAKSQNGW